MRHKIEAQHNYGDVVLQVGQDGVGGGRKNQQPDQDFETLKKVIDRLDMTRKRSNYELVEHHTLGYENEVGRAPCLWPLIR